MKTWIGRKKIAFLPVRRSNANPPDQPVPADWPGEIMRRIFLDPLPPSGADQSLRTFISAASSGRADLDAEVLPIEVIARQDVAPDAFEEKYGKKLRKEGFEAAALVMLGGPGAGSAEAVGGFWARFVMAEGVAVWAMELIHCLAAIDDLYTFGGNMEPFELMASNVASLAKHPSAFTKSLMGWLDPLAIVQHKKHTAGATYKLHAVGLVQPPPTGRVAAVRVGSQVPYLMIEARLMNDPFEGNIPSQGVIVYQVQTSSPQGSAQNQLAPLQLLTTTALKVGETFTSSNLTVKVFKALSGGFSIIVDDALRAVGFVTSYDAAPVDTDSPPGPNNPLMQTIMIDSMPGFLFTATGGQSFKFIIKKAQDDHRRVEITYTPTGPQSGEITDLELE